MERFLSFSSSYCFRWSLIICCTVRFLGSDRSSWPESLLRAGDFRTPDVEDCYDFRAAGDLDFGSGGDFPASIFTWEEASNVCFLCDRREDDTFDFLDFGGETLGIPTDLLFSTLSPLDIGESRCLSSVTYLSSVPALPPSSSTPSIFLNPSFQYACPAFSLVFLYVIIS